MAAAGLAFAPAQAEVKFSERLTKIAENLGDGGVHFSVTDSKGDLQQVGKMIDKLIGFVPEEEFPLDLQVESLLDDLGLYSLQGRGSSSHQIGDVWHNRSFVLTDGKHEGLLSLLGGESEKPAASFFAPAQADLVLESSLNLREVERTVKKVSKAFGGKVEEGVAEGFKEEVLDLGINIADLFADFTVRGTVVLWLDEEKTFEMQPGMNLPVPHLAARLENAGLIWKMLESDLRGKSTVEEKDGEIILTPKDGPEQPPFGPVMPRVVWKADSKELLFGLTAEDLAFCRSDGPRLGASDSYQKATEGFPENLSSLAYVSSDVCRLAESLAKELKSQVPPEGQGVVDELLPYLELLGVKGGYAAGVAVQKDGFLGLANMPFPMKGGSSMVGPADVAGIAVLAGLATPAILKARKSADRAKTINQLKQLGVLLTEYQLDHGKYPDQLDDLIETELLPRKQWLAMGLDTVIYLPGANEGDRASRILAYQELPKSGEVIVLNLDISVRSEPAELVQERLREQKK